MENKRHVYMVYREGGGMPAKVHYSRDEAVDEAKRLAELPVSVRNHASFYIMQAVETVKAVEPEVIKKGDTVRYGCATSQEWVVVWLRKDCVNVLIQYKDNIPVEATKQRLKLIRKGTEVITFEGATDIEFYCKGNFELRKGPITMTLKEEVSDE